MPCYHPVRGYRSESGAFQFKKGGSTGLRMSVPCGRCIGCRLERSRQWAVRIMHEASMHDASCFVTLTYADEYLPPRGSLDRSAFPLFMKRLRRRIEPVRVRYFHCGEYGDLNGRPHYHACLFGYEFPDRSHWTTRGDHRVYRSPLLEEVWPLGQSEIGTLTFESAAYVARYVTKKVTGGRAEEHYERVDEDSGEVYQLEPEYATMSRRPGIGRGWINRYLEEVYPADEVVVRGFESKPPRYYDQVLQGERPELAEEVRRARMVARDKQDQTEERLSVRKECAEARMSLLKRKL